MNNTQSPLPKGWIWTTLGEVSLDPQYGWTTKAVEDGTLHILRTTDITSGQIDWRNVPYCLDEPPVKEKYLLKDGDVVISRAGSVGYSHLIKNPKSAVFASYLIRFRPIINEQFFAYFLKSPPFWQAISEKSVGIALQNVNASKLRQIVIPIAPLPEQHRIVTKIEELFTQLYAGVASLKKVQAQLKRYRQAVLKAAFEGRLTQEWREQHKGEIEPADVLIDKIKQERSKKITKNRDSVIDIDVSSLPQLPEFWSWAKFGELFLVKPGGTPSRSVTEYWGGSIPWVSSGEVANCLISETNESITKIGVENSNAKLNPVGTVLLAMIGEGKTRGQTAIMTIEAATNQNVSAIRCPDTPISSKYIFYWFLKNYNDNRRKGSGGMQQALNARIISEMVFPLPPLSEQPEIILEIERHFSQIDHLDQTITTSLRQAETLRQSILKRAFEGKLVPQDPNDEPASILLERIKAEKAHHTAEAKKGKTLQPKSPKRRLPNGN